MTQLTDMPDAVDSAHQRKTLRRGSRAMTTAAGSHAVEPRSRLHALGVTTVVAGPGLARQPVLAGAGRWLPLIMGGYVFVVMFPEVFGLLVAGRIAIGVWMLMFAALGASLVRADPGGSR